MRNSNRKAARLEKRATRVRNGQQQGPGGRNAREQVYTATVSRNSRTEHLDDQTNALIDSGTAPIKSAETGDRGTLQSSSSPLKEYTSASESDHTLVPRAKQAEVPRAVAERLAEDDARIKVLERKLGLRGKKKLSNSFDDDGLGELLGNLGGSDSDTAKRKRNNEEGECWLREKRKRAKFPPSSIELGNPAKEDESGTSEKPGSVMESAVTDDHLTSGSGEFSDFDDDNTDEETPPQPRRENPYLPAAQPDDSTTPRYVPPSLRVRDSPGGEEFVQLRRRIQGTLNRLSEANMLAIVGEVEKLYRQNPRQHVTTLLLDVLYGLICDPSPLQDTFMILHGGFIAALHRTLGNEFAAQAIQRFVEEFDSTSSIQDESEAIGKKMLNLTTFLAELYNFQVVGSSLVYDYIRMFVKHLSEEHTELLLKIAKLSGPQLRQDEPSSLKDIVLLIQTAVAKLGSDSLSVRTMFMIETIENLKNNRMKTGQVASSISSEHTVRMKKALGTLRQRTSKATEPLRVTLQDIRNSDKQGKWWLVGASYRDKDVTVPARAKDTEGESGDATAIEPTNDLLQLAREQRMNTDVRRSIFVTLLSSNDYKDATERLLRLRLKKTQEREIPKVIVHCAGAETAYNPFYTIISKQLCGDRKIKMAFQFCLWDLFKMMEGDEEGGEDDSAQGLDMRALVNLAKLYGALVASGRLNLLILKVCPNNHSDYSC